MTLQPLFKGALIAAVAVVAAAPFTLDASAAAQQHPHAAPAKAPVVKTLKAHKDRGAQKLFTLGNKSVGQALKTRGQTDWPATLVLVNKTEHTLFAAIKVREEWIQIAHLTPYAKAEVRLPNAEFTVDAAYKDAQGQLKNFGPEVADFSAENGPLTWNLTE